MCCLLARAQFTSMKAKVAYVCGEGYLMASDEGRHYLAKVIKVGLEAGGRSGRCGRCGRWGWVGGTGGAGGRGAGRGLGAPASDSTQGCGGHVLRRRC